MARGHIRRTGSSLGTLFRIGLLWGFLLAPGSTAADAALEYDVKAAFLLNFTKFIEWPPSAFAGPQSPFEICVLGQDPFGRALDEVLQGETVNGRPLVSRRITQPPTAKNCQLLFVDAALKDLDQILAALPHGILTVGEGDSFLKDGGMIAFILDNRRVRFDINQTAADHAGIKLSAKLLTVARSIAR